MELLESRRKLDRNTLGKLGGVFSTSVSRRKPTYIKLLVFGILTTALQAVVYLSIVPLLKHAETGNPISKFGISVIALDTTEYFTIFLILCLLLFIAVELKYQAFKVASEIWQATAEDQIRLTVDKMQQEIRGKYPKHQPHALKTRFLKSINQGSFACGYFCRQIALSANDFIFFVTLVVILFAINFSITLVLFLISIVPISLFVRSYFIVADNAERRQQFDAGSRTEIRGIYDELIHQDLNENEIKQMVERMLHRGFLGKYLATRIQVRQSIKRGASFIEFLNPISLIIIGGIAVLTIELEFSISLIIVYFLILRQLVSALMHISESIISINHFYPHIMDHVNSTDYLENRRAGPEEIFDMAEE